MNKTFCCRVVPEWYCSAACGRLSREVHSEFSLRAVGDGRAPRAARLGHSVFGAGFPRDS